MRPDKILYVDDEPMALKYFERLVSPIAPVLTALSVEEGRAILRERGHEIAVLISDQRMPTAYGNELLRYARDHHPTMVRMLTTAYSELGEAIEAINTGEIYRYITKPWDLENLRADLRNALELSSLRSERDEMLREKLAVQQQQLLASRAAQLATVCAGFVRPDYEAGLHAFLTAAAASGCAAPAIDWRAMDHADLMQNEAQRGVAIGQALAAWMPRFGRPTAPAEAAAALARALPTQFTLQGEAGLVANDRTLLTWPLEGAVGERPAEAQVAWLAWLLAIDFGVTVIPADGVFIVQLTAASAAGDDWLAGDIEELLQAL
ncbi:MAG: hypothetical protein JWP29_911 [Rhodoferax sp.]|nr:hypothetical protein [Rhodoferax sp.]